MKNTRRLYLAVLLILVIALVLLSTVVANADPKHPVDQARAGLATAIEQADSQCAAETDLKHKVPLINRLIRLQRTADILGLDDILSWEGMCGCVLQSEIHVMPNPVQLDEIGDEQQLAARIFDGCGKELSGELVWWSSAPSTVEVDQWGVVVAKGKGTGTVFVASKDIPEIMGRVEVEVGQSAAFDVALVIQCDHATYDLIGFPSLAGNIYVDGLRQLADEVPSLLEEKLGEDCRFAAVAFGNHPSVVDYTAQWPGYQPYWDGPYYDILAPFKFWDSTSSEALAATRLMIDDTSVPNQAWNGKSVYSAALHAIEDLNWREDAYRAVIVYSNTGVGYWWWAEDVLIDTEYPSLLNSSQVITAANEAGVHLFMMNAGGGGYQDRMRDPFAWMATLTGGWYTEDGDDVWPMLNVLNASLDAVASMQ